MTKRDALIAIETEIQWCKENPANMPKDFLRGFIDGLKQAKDIIRKLPVTN
jgi:hypothetical protein